MELDGDQNLNRNIQSHLFMLILRREICLWNFMADYQKYYQPNDRLNNRRYEFYRQKDSFRQAIAILAKGGIEVDNSKAMVIVDFLYLMEKNQKKEEKEKTPKPQRENEL